MSLKKIHKNDSNNYEGACYMNINKNKKVLVITDVEQELVPILQKTTNIQPENMLTIESYGCIISHPYGDIMRSVIMAIYEENVEDIFVVGTKDKSHRSIKLPTQLEKDKIKTLDYLFKNSTPELQGGTLDAWLNGSGNVSENIKKSVEVIRHHALVPLHVNVQGLMIDNNGGVFSIVDPSTSTMV